MLETNLHEVCRVAYARGKGTRQRAAANFHDQALVPIRVLKNPLDRGIKAIAEGSVENLSQEGRGEPLSRKVDTILRVGTIPYLHAKTRTGRLFHLLRVTNTFTTPIGDDSVRGLSSYLNALQSLSEG